MNTETYPLGLWKILLAALSLTTLGHAQSTQTPLEMLPYSPSMLVARAIRAGKILPRSAGALSCGQPAAMNFA